MASVIGAATLKQFPVADPPPAPGTGYGRYLAGDDSLPYFQDAAGTLLPLVYSGSATSFVSVSVTGTAGAGYYAAVAQASAPSAPAATGWRTFADANGDFAYRKKNSTDTYVRTFASTLTADRIYTLPDVAGNVILSTSAAFTKPVSITGSTDAIQLTILGNSSQTAALQEWQNSSGTMQARLSADGRLALGASAFSDATTYLQVSPAINPPTSGTLSAARITPNYTLNAGSTGVYIGLTVGQTIDANSFTDSQLMSARGFNAIGTATGATGTLHSVAGGVYLARNLSTVTLTATYGSYVFASTGTQTNAISSAIIKQTVGSSSNTHVFLAATGSAQPAAGNWDLYSATNYQSQLSGQLAIVGSSDQIQLIVKGNSSQTTNKQEWQNSSGTVHVSVGASTIASGASATMRMFYVAGSTITLTGSTNITTATGFNFVEIAAPTYSAASALTIDRAATLYLGGAPSGAGAGPATITSPYTLWIDSGASRFDGNLDLSNAAVNVILQTATGTQWATAVSQKQAWWGATPVVQPSGAAQAAVTTTAATNVTPYGFTTQAQADGIITLLNEIRNVLVTIGKMKGSA